MTAVVGIDPSLSGTGVAVSADGSTWTRRIATNSADVLAASRERIRYIVGMVLQEAPSRCLTVIERPYVPQGQGDAGSLIERGWLFGLLVDQLMVRGHVVQVYPSTRAKYGADAGGADKKAVVAAVHDAYPALPIRSHDEADALVLAAMGARYLGEPIDGEPSKPQLQAMSAVRWPTPYPKEKD